MEYAEVIDSYNVKAEKVGLDFPDTAWLDLEGVWWPNPYYDGEPAVHPECKTVFHTGRIDAG